MTNPELELPDWSECLFDESYRYFAIRGGRGSAKSHTVGSALVIRAAQKQKRILCGREIQKSIKASVKQLLDDKIEQNGLRGFYESTETEIRGRNGSQFLFAGVRTNVDSIKSMEGIDIFWGEESQTFSQDSLNIIVPTIRKPQSQLFFTWNPRHATDPIDVMFGGDSVPPNTKRLTINYKKNPWFPDVLRADMEYDRRRDRDKYQHIWEGEYVSNSEARVFRNWHVEEFEAPQDAVHRLGADWGFSVDPTVLVRCHIIGRTIYIDYEAYKIGCPIPSIPDLFMTVPAAEKWPITADSQRPDLIDYMKREGGFRNIFGAVKGPGSVEDGIEFLLGYDIVVHPRCNHVIDELSLYSYKVDDLTGAVLPVLADKDNHVIDSLRYAFEGVRRIKQVNKPINVRAMPMKMRWR